MAKDFIQRVSSFAATPRNKRLHGNGTGGGSATGGGYAASVAVRLQTPRRLWGQPFDGTADAAGHMRNVGDIHMGRYIFLGSGEVGPYISNRTDGGFAVSMHDEGDTYTSTLLSITPDGKVGVGSADPAFPLEVSGAVKADELHIGGATLSWDAAAGALKIDKTLYSEGGLSALGLSGDTPGGGGGGGGVSYDRLDEWEDYSEGDGSVLSAKLGVELRDALDNYTVTGMVTIDTAQTVTGMKTFADSARFSSAAMFLHPDAANGVYMTGSADGGLAWNAHRDWTFTAGLASLAPDGRFSAKRLKSEAPQGTAPLEVNSSTVCANLNADMLDGLHSGAFARADANTAADLNNINGRGVTGSDSNAAATTARHYPINEAGALIYGDAAYGSSCQIYGSYLSNRWFARGGGSGPAGKTAWREFAFSDSNVASATKLQTPRDIWGKPFDGTGYIDGHMTGVADINTAAEPARVAYLGAMHDGNAWGAGKGVVNIAITDNTNETPLLLAYRKGTSDMAGANRVFSMELRNNGGWMDIRFAGAQKYQLDNAGNFYAVGGVTCLSDMRCKEVTHSIDLRVEDIAAAPVFAFTWKGDADGAEQAGSSAQHWERLLPWLVPERGGRKSLAYDKAALISAVGVARETVRLKRENKGLTDGIARLETENAELRKRLAEIERILGITQNTSEP